MRAVDAEISQRLDARESLLWSGRPRQGLVLRASDAFLIPFSLMWGGFSIFWEVSVLSTDAPGFMAVWGIPFVLMGLYLIFGRFFVDAAVRSRTSYGLTNQRVIIASGLFGRSMTSLPLRTLDGVSLREKADGRGTVMFGQPSPYGQWSEDVQWPGMGRMKRPCFEMIEQAKRVHDQVLEAQRRAT